MVAVNITVLILQGASGVRAGQASVLYLMKTSVLVSDAFTLAAFTFTLFNPLRPYGFICDSRGGMQIEIFLPSSAFIRTSVK